MRWRPETVVVLLAAAAALAQPPPRPIGEIEFFGHRGLDVESVRAALPIREGDTFPSADAPPDELKGRIGESVRRVLARSPTDVSFTCCDDHERWMVYVGLPGESYRAVRYHAPPTGSDRLPPELVTLDDETEEATQAAIMRGDATEDDSQGFALSRDPALRAKQMAIREYALIELPMQPLCRTDCKGICPICGADRNTEECRCQDEETDDRFAALKALLDDNS